MRTKGKGKPKPLEEVDDRANQHQVDRVTNILKVNVQNKTNAVDLRDSYAQDAGEIVCAAGSTTEEVEPSQYKLTEDCQAILDYVTQTLQDGGGLGVQTESVTEEDVRFNSYTDLMLWGVLGVESSMVVSTSRFNDVNDRWLSPEDKFQNDEDVLGGCEQEENQGSEGDQDMQLPDCNPWDKSVFVGMNVETVPGLLVDAVMGQAPGFSDEQLIVRENSETVAASRGEPNTGRSEGDSRLGLTEKDIEIFLDNEMDAHKQDTPFEIDSKYVPEDGMRFSTRGEAQKFCGDYAYRARFSIVVASTYRTMNKKKDNEITKLTLRCNKYGRAYGKEQEPVDSIVPERQTSVIAKTGCKASLVVKEDNGEWVISSVNLEHNHILGPCTEIRFFRTHKFMSHEEKDIIKTLKKVNTPTRNIVAILSNMRGGRTNLSYDDKDVANYSYKVGRERTMNDMTQMLNYFSEKQDENPGFYYSVYMEAGNKVRNIFWADAKAREYYAVYGDCISFVSHPIFSQGENQMLSIYVPGSNYTHMLNDISENIITQAQNV